ncbi:MAG: antibiotic biosynthesis monooxygenase family protein [bacterium]
MRQPYPAPAWLDRATINRAAPRLDPPDAEPYYVCMNHLHTHSTNKHEPAPTLSPAALPPQAGCTPGGRTLELLRFRATPPATTAEIDDASARVGAYLPTLPGFEQRQIARSADGLLIDAVVWESLEQAEDASLVFMSSPEALSLLSRVDFSTVSIIHPRVLRSLRYATTPPAHLEAVVFRAKPGTTRRAFLDAFDNAEPHFRATPGLLSHELALAPDGQWVHLVRWTDALSHDAAAKSLPSKPDVGVWFSMINGPQMTLTRGDIVPGRTP